MKKIKFSIIIPVYNGEKYIEKCIDNILNQTYDNFELIIINDGSTDNTKKIINNIKDKRLVIFNNKNHGVSYSRNFGLKKAKGDYILFVDADDFISEKTLEVLVEKISKYDVDIIRFNGLIQQKDKSYKKIEMPISDNTIINSCEKSKIIKILNSPQNSIRCYSPLLLLKNKNVKEFDTNLKYLEDKVFYLENMMTDNKKILFCSDELYYYNYNDMSRTKNTKIFKNNIDEIIKAGEKIKKVVSKHINETNECDTAILVLIMYRIKYLANSTRYKEFKTTIKEVHNDCKLRGLLNMTHENLSTKNKIMYFLLKNKLLLLFYMISKIK